MASRALTVDPKPVTTDRNIAPVETIRVDENAIAARAYALWQDRGCPNGSDQEDWFRAEQELRLSGSMPTTA